MNRVIKFSLYSLQGRLVVLLLLPVALILFSAGGIGYNYAHQKILAQWNEAAILKLERAAHQIDMRLSKPMELMSIFLNLGNGLDGAAGQQRLLRQLETLDGIAAVDLLPTGESQTRSSASGAPGHHMGMNPMMPFKHGVFSKITPPSHDAFSGDRTVSLISDLLDDGNRKVAELHIKLRFDYLMEDVLNQGWWQGDMACLVDKDGNYLIHTGAMSKERQKLGETGDPLELAILSRMRRQPQATVRGPGHTPEMVAGFSSLKQAPWVIVEFAPGRKILAPIVRFRNGFIAGALVMAAGILWIVRRHVGSILDSIHKISASARQVAQGEYGDPIDIQSKDEIGDLVDNYNAMVAGLRERDHIRNTFGCYIDADFAKKLLSRPEAARLGGQRREVVILMSDIRGYTTLVERMNPETAIEILNLYFTHMIAVIQRHKGIIVDFVGDAILVFFEPLNETLVMVSQRAIRCASQMQQAMIRTNEELRTKGHPNFEMGIGIHAGAVVVGNIGSKARAKYGIVGSAVNLTQRVQDQAKGSEIVVTEAVFDHVKDDVAVLRAFQTRLKGIQTSANLFIVSEKRKADESA